MNKLKSTCIGVVLLGITCSGFSFAQEEETNSRNDSLLTVHLSLDTPNLVPQAVQFAIFDTDPVPAFQASLKKLKTYHQAELERAEGEKKRNQIRRSFLEVHWNMGFRAITGDRVNLLISAPDVTQSIVANSKQGKKWLVTKTRYLNKELICWCVPFEVKAGEKNEIVVSEQNAFDLEAAYKEVMSASN